MAKIAKDTAPLSTQRSGDCKGPTIRVLLRKDRRGWGVPEPQITESLLRGSFKDACLFNKSLCNTCCVLYIQL